MRCTYLLLLIFCMSMSYHISFCQSNGLLIDDEAYEEMPLFPFPEIRGDEVPSYVSLRSYCPTPGDQGYTSTCVGWALSHALTIKEAINNQTRNRTQIDRMAYSAAYIYNQITPRGNCQDNIRLNDGIKILMQKGDCLRSSFKFDPSNCNRLPGPRHDKEAVNARIRNAPRLSNLNYIADRKIDIIRYAIARQWPVVIGMRVPNSFRQNDPTRSNWRTAIDGHAMVVVGYDDDDGEGTFEVMNSYGPNWGSGGFFKIGYYDLAANLLYGYILDLDS